MLVDSHCHLHLMKKQDPNLNLDILLRETYAKKIQHLLCVGTDLCDLKEILEITKLHPFISASVGLHPTENIENEPSVEKLISLGAENKVIAIGETGLDYYRKDTQISQQQTRFRTHIQAAKFLKKPLIIHTRAAQIDTIKILQEENADQIGGVMHCFTESIEMAKKALDLNFYISFSGIITFKNAEEIREVVKKVPLERLLVETDSPYLAPVPFRGKMNQPAYVQYVAECVAELHKKSFSKICDITTQNFADLFKISI